MGILDYSIEFPQPIQQVDDKTMLAVGLMLTRCLSSGFFLNALKNSVLYG